MKWQAKFESLEGWFEYGPLFDGEEQAIAFAIDYANSNTNVIDFDVVQHAA